MMVLSVSAQGLAEQPQVGFQSTSSMTGSGSTLPQAATTGAYTTYDMGNSAPARTNRPGIRTRPGDQEEPYQDPIGDAALPLALLAMGYGAFVLYRKHRQTA